MCYDDGELLINLSEPGFFTVVCFQWCSRGLRHQADLSDFWNFDLQIVLIL